MRSANAGSRTSSQRVGHPALVASSYGTVGAAEAEGHVVGHREVREQGVALEDRVDRAPVGRVSDTSCAVDEDPAGVGRSKPAIIRRVVVLPQPDGPSSGEELAGADVEIDAVDRGEVPEPLDQLDQPDGSPCIRAESRID